MIFRKVRSSNDLGGWLNAGFSLVATMLCVYFFATGWQVNSFWLRLGQVVLGIFSIGSIFAAIRGVIRPFEIELVVEGDVIRWGKSLEPRRQECLPISKIKGLIYEHGGSDGCAIFADTGKISLTPLGHGILFGSLDCDAFVKGLQGSFPRLIVEIQQ